MTVNTEKITGKSSEAILPGRPLDVFHLELEKIKDGRVERIDLVTFNNNLDGQISTMSNLVKQIEGPDRLCFSDQEIQDDLVAFFQELTEEQEPFNVLWAMRREGDVVRDSSHSHHDILTILLDSVSENNVQLGVSVVTDESRDWSWTYFISQPQKPKFKFSELFKLPAIRQTGPWI